MALKYGLGATIQSNNMAKSPQEVLATDVAKLRRVGQSLFTTNEPEYITRDKGHYAFLIAKPSKRLANVLSLDREILALFSPFTDQQQRTEIGRASCRERV